MARFASAGTLYEIGLQELGEAIIQQALRDAAKVFLGTQLPKQEAQEIQQSVLFIRGSGLEAITEEFHLNLDVETLQHQFQWKLRQFVVRSTQTLSGHTAGK